MTNIYRIVERSNEFSGGTIAVAETFEGHYIGNPNTARMLCDERGIWPELRGPTHKVCSIGFCPDENKWYGWSHRAIYGFGIGSTVKKGNCGYVADNPEEMIDDYANFFADISKECADQHRAECQILPDRSGIRILHTPIELQMANSVEEALDSLDDGVDLPTETIWNDAVSENKCGRGEWTANTMEDARQMACDFAEGVS